MIEQSFKASNALGDILCMYLSMYLSIWLSIYPSILSYLSLRNFQLHDCFIMLFIEDEIEMWKM